MRERLSACTGLDAGVRHRDRAARRMPATEMAGCGDGVSDTVDLGRCEEVALWSQVPEALGPYTSLFRTLPNVARLLFLSIRLHRRFVTMARRRAISSRRAGAAVPTSGLRTLRVSRVSRPICSQCSRRGVVPTSNKQSRARSTADVPSLRVSGPSQVATGAPIIQAMPLSSLPSPVVLLTGLVTLLRCWDAESCALRYNTSHFQMSSSDCECTTAAREPDPP